MNKDVIYIEPEDDITDIISKLGNSKESIVALVPPQKSAVMHSAVNIKLIVKTALAKNKKIVFVTSDSLVIKLAAALHIPVTANLQTAPAIPVLNPEDKAASVVEEIKEEVIEEPTDSKEKEEKEEETEKKDEEKTDSKESKKKAKKDKKISDNPVFGWIQEHKKTTIISSSALAVFILFVIWALVIAPAATIIVTVRTTANNFSQSATFTTKLEEEDATTGKFYLTEKKIENSTKVKFDATGTKNLGEKASGTITVAASFGTLYSVIPGTITVASGSQFTYNNLNYVANEAISLSVNSAEECDAWDESMSLSEAKNTKCLQTATISITAAESGANYNIENSSYEWTSGHRLYSIYNAEAISGGSDKIITVVQQSDVDKAKEELSSSSNTNDKQKLMAEFDTNEMPIESSFKQTAGEIKVTPDVGEEVKEGDTPMIESTSTSTMYGIDQVKVEEFIKIKANISDNQDIYKINESFVENFTSTDGGYSGKLKASYLTGPRVSEEDIMEKAKGKKVGEAQSIIKSISGVSSVTIERSFFWVNSIPSDPNKITINLIVEE